MKIKSILATAALLGVLASSASAITVLDPVQAAAPVKFEAPVPAQVGSIQLPHFHQGADVTVRMTIDENGQPHNVRVTGTRNQAAYKRLVSAVSQWKFTPGRKNGQAVATRVELPLEVKGL